MISERKCLDCGAPLTADEPQPVCPRCVFQRLARTGSTIVPPETGLAAAPAGTAGRDFHAEYELLGELGRGGMGVIYKAHQPRLNRVVAIKVIHAAELAGEAARRRFESEMQMAGRLNHPNIAPIFDTGEMDGCPCFSMEYFAGGALAARMREFTARPEAGVRLLVKVARAVSFAHQRGVLHRDLKPANILLDEAGEPHVADFGLAKQMGSDSDLTRSGAVLGSPNYMSPEQAAGKSDSLTVATDVYSLGVVLYEMLTGRTPFVAGSALETLRRVVEEEAQRPSTIVARVNGDLETICLKCLRKEPERRYHTAEELADDLDRWLRHEPIQARPVAGLERFQMWARRHPALATVSALFIVVLIAGFAAVTWQWRRAELSSRNEAAQRQRAEAALGRSAIALAESLLRGGDAGKARDSLESVPVDLRDAEWQYLMAEADSSRPLPPLGIGKIDDLAAHPGRPSVFAAAGHGGKIVLFDVRTGAHSLEFTPEFPVADSGAELRIAFSETGDRVAIGRTGPGGIVIHDVANGQRIAGWDASPSARLEFSPDGFTLLQISADGQRLEVWDIAKRASRWRHDDADYSASFTTDGTEVACYSRKEKLRLVRAADGTAKTSLSQRDDEQVVVQPGGTLLLVGSPLGRIRGYDLQSGRSTREIHRPDGSINHVAFLPGGERFLTAATLPDNTFALQRWDLSMRQLTALAGAKGAVRILRVHPLSGELIVCAQEDRVWETSGFPPLQTIRSRHPRPSAAFWGADDTLFAPGADETGAVFQTLSSSNAPAALWTSGSEFNGEVSISANGQRAALGWYRATRPIAVLERPDAEIVEVASLQPAGPLDYARLSPNGDRLIAVERNFTQLEVFEVATGKPAAASLDMSEVLEITDLTWLDGGRRVAGLVTSYSPQQSPTPIRQVILWDASTGQRLIVVTNQLDSRVVCASPDGQRFAEAGAGRTVRIRDGATLTVLAEFRAHNEGITALAWHPKRPILATASINTAVRLWDLGSGSRLEEFNGPLAPPRRLSFSPGGTRLATAFHDSGTWIWEPRSLATPAPKM